MKDPLNIPKAIIVKDRPRNDLESLRDDVNKVIAVASSKPRLDAAQRTTIYLACIVCSTVEIAIWIIRHG